MQGKTEQEARQLIDGLGSYFAIRPLHSKAFQLSEAIEVKITAKRILRGNPGDWLVHWPNGELEILPNDSFKRKHLPGAIPAMAP